MQYDFLKDFSKRMKVVGLYSQLVPDSRNTVLKDYGFEDIEQQMNLIYSVLLFIMEQSLKEEDCKIEDLCEYIECIFFEYFDKNLGKDDCKQICGYILDDLLSNKGKVIYFKAFDFETKSYKSIHINYIANKIVYDEHNEPHTSYYLTDDGYNLLLGTLEVESNLKFTVQEMVFKLHLDKQSYDKALIDIKQLFNLLRIQIQKIQDNKRLIKQNVLSYEVEKYKNILDENLEILGHSQNAFEGYRENVNKRLNDIKENHMELEILNDIDIKNIKNLQEICHYLDASLGELLKVYSEHLEFDKLYEDELMKFTEARFLKRFDLKESLFNKLFEQPKSLENLDLFFKPLFINIPNKIFNLNTVSDFQSIKRAKDGVATEIEDFDSEKYYAEQKELRFQKMLQYEKSLTCLLDWAWIKKKDSLKCIVEAINSDEKLIVELIPKIEIFKEIMVNLLRCKEIDMSVLRKEQSNSIYEDSDDFQIKEMLLKIINTNETFMGIHRIEIHRRPDEIITLNNIPVDNSNLVERKDISCTNVLFKFN